MKKKHQYRVVIKIEDDFDKKGPGFEWASPAHKTLISAKVEWEQACRILKLFKPLFVDDPLD